MTTKNPNKSPKNKLTPINDISKSLLLIKWEKNPTFNLNITTLHTCKDEKNKTRSRWKLPSKYFKDSKDLFLRSFDWLNLILSFSGKKLNLTSD